MKVKPYLKITNTRALQLFQLFRQGFLILIALVFANSSLSKEQIGIYELLTYLAYLLSFFWVSGGIQALLSLYPKLNEQQKPRMIFLAFAVFTALSVLIIGANYVLQQWSLPLLLQRSELTYLGWFTLFLLSSLPANLQEYFYLLQERPKVLLAYGASSSLLQFLCVAIPVFLGMPYVYAFIALFVLGALKFLWLAVFSLRWGQRTIDLVLLKKWAYVAWPLVVYTLLGAFNIAIGPWFVGYFTDGDAASFATFRYGARELPLLTALAGALSSALIPAIAANQLKGYQELKEKSSKLYHLLFPVSLLMLLTSQWWFVALFGQRFEAAVPVFNTFLLTVIPSMVFARTILIAIEDTKWIPLSSLASILVNIIASLYLGAQLGLQGIALGMLLAFVFEKAVLVYYLKQKHQLSLAAYTRVYLLVLYSVLMVVAYCWLSF